MAIEKEAIELKTIHLWEISIHRHIFWFYIGVRKSLQHTINFVPVSNT